MKQSLNQVKKSALFSSLALALVLIFASCTKSDVGISTALMYSLSGTASGSQAVPASSNSNGSGNFSGTYNSSTRVMSYTSTWSNLTGPPLTGGLYTGAAGQVGASITAWSLSSGLGTSGSFSSSTTLNADQQAQLLAGKCYYILGTAANATGEIRGQITASVQ